MMTKVNKQLIKIVRAVPGDAEVICDIRDRAWIEAYPNAELGISAEQIVLNAKGRNEEFLPRRIAYLKEQLSKNDKTELTTYVAKVEGKVVGYVGLCTDEQGRRRIGAMYVAPEAQGMGIGGKLMRHALDVLGHDKDIYLDVVSYNQNAIDFYKHFGFEKTNAIVLDDEEAPDYVVQLPNIEMVLRATGRKSS